MIFEEGSGLGGSLRALWRATTVNRIALGFTSFLFAATGPLVILLTSASQARLPLDTTISWIFTIYLVGGIGTLFLALYYRQPIVLAWSIPGAALVADALTKQRFSDVLGAYLVVAILLLVLGVTGVVKWITNWIPLPVLLGMVAAVLLPYGIAIFRAADKIPTIAYPSIALYVGLVALPSVARVLPPVLCTLILALILASITGNTNWTALQANLVSPVIFTPTFDFGTIVSLVPPLLVAVLAIQNGQGTAVLLSQGYKPPINSMTFACGIASIVNMFFGGHSACIAGPSVAIVGGPDGGEREGRFAGAVWGSFFWIVFALVAPVAASLDKVLLTAALIPMLGGLAMLPVLGNVLAEAFSGKFRNGALFALLITLSDIKIGGIGAAFWGLIGGLLAVVLLDRQIGRAHV